MREDASTASMIALVQHVAGLVAGSCQSCSFRCLSTLVLHLQLELKQTEASINISYVWMQVRITLQQF